MDINKKPTPQKQAEWDLLDAYEFIQRIESTTNDRFTQKKIRDFMIQKEIWKDESV